MFLVSTCEIIVYLCHLSTYANNFSFNRCYTACFNHGFRSTLYFSLDSFVNGACKLYPEFTVTVLV